MHASQDNAHSVTPSRNFSIYSIHYRKEEKINVSLLQVKEDDSNTVKMEYILL